MGMMDKMMERMSTGFKPEDKGKTVGMMGAMMESTFSKMTGEEMSAMMHDMMPKMMESCFSKMADEQRKRMLDMCRKMLDEIEKKYSSEKA